MKHKILLFSMIIMLVTSLVIVGCPAPVPEVPEVPVVPVVPVVPTPEPIKFNMLIGAGIKTCSQMFVQATFMDQINERANGQLIITVLGGEEVMSREEQMTALSKGSLDLASATTSWYIGAMPEAAVFTLSRCAGLEERETGFYDYMVQRHKEALNAYYLGRQTIFGSSRGGYYTFLSVPIRTPYELAGMKIRVTTSDAAFAAALGASGVVLTHPDTFSALQTNLVNGLMTPFTSYASHGYAEVAPYMIDHGFYENNVVMLMSLDSWNRLPQNLQDLVSEVELELEAASAEASKACELLDLQAQKDKWGLTQIYFTPADAKWYLDQAYEAEWEEVGKNIDPATVAKLKEMLKS